MALKDFFSHKIFSSPPEWAERLCLIAHILHKHNGECFVSCRDELTREFADISPRFSPFRKNSPWRDEMTAYVSHLGVAHFQRESGAWLIKTTETAREFLLGEAPDVAAFLRMQLPLFQFPNAMGVQHKGKGWVTPNTLGKTWEFVQAGMHVSPVRLLAVALKADARLREVDLLSAQTTAGEVYALANHRDIFPHALPPEDAVAGVLADIRAGKVNPPPRYEGGRFHLLNHMQVFDVVGKRRKHIGFRRATGEADKKLLLSHFHAIAAVKACFTEFDDCQTKAELQEKILSGSWGTHFDALNHLSGEAVVSLAKDEPAESAEKAARQPSSGVPPLRDFTGSVRPYTQKGALRPAQVIADPEATRIKKERRNVAHALMVYRLMEWLKDTVGIQNVGDSPLVDLWAELPGGRGTFIFEVKSGGEGIAEQVRKGVSQLYEYRYRYAREMKRFKGARLCLVLPGVPSIEWMPDYLCRDRGINLCILQIDEDAALPDFHELSRNPIVADSTPRR